MGFVLGGGIGCIDLDKCFSGGELLTWAREIMDANRDALLVEVSRSGNGLHLFVWMDSGKGEVTRDGRNIEVYPPDSGRFIATTGNRYFG